MEDTDLAQYPGLYRRKGSSMWCVRKRVPDDLRAVERRFQVRLSLETADLRQAKSLYHIKMAEIVEGFRLQRVALEERDGLDRALALGRLEDLGRAEMQKLVMDWWAKREPCRAPQLDEDDDPADVLADIRYDAARSREAENGELAHESTVDRLLVEAGLVSKPYKAGPFTTSVLYSCVDKGSAAYKRLCELIGRALRVEEELACDHITGGQATPFDPLFNPTGARRVDRPVASAATVREFINEYRAEREQVLGKESTDRKYGLLFRLLEELWDPELPSSKITRTMCVEVYTFLQRLPPNATKRFRTMTLTEAANHAQQERLRGLGGTTVSTYMQNLSAMLRWASNEVWGVNVSTKGIVKKRRPNVRRRGFEADELTQLFRPLALMRESSPGKFWIPALAAYTGARQGELCQLRTEDVINVGGVWCLDLSVFTVDGLRDEAKRQKTEASERIVPLHDELLASGFMDYVATQVGEHLFPDLTVSAEGSRSENFSKWFGRFRKDVGLGQPALVFHSFRHGFRDACRDADIPEETAHALGGWAAEKEGQKYGRRGAVPNLRRALKRIGYHTFRLSELVSSELGHTSATHSIKGKQGRTMLQPVAVP